MSPTTASDSTTSIPQLLPHHREHLHASGLSDATIDGAGMFSIVDPADAAGLLHWGGAAGPVPAIAIPIWGSGGDVTQIVLRPDAPRIRDDGSSAKYEQPVGEHHRVWFPPAGLVAPERLLDPTQPLIWTEGAKKALAAIQAGGIALSMQGVSVWHDPDWRAAHKGQPGEWRLHPDLAPVPLRGRRIYIAFDGGDTTGNPPVILAEARLARMLIEAGVDVWLVRVPASADGPKVGLDDYLVSLPEAERTETLAGLLAEALPGDPCARLAAAVAEAEASKAGKPKAEVNMAVGIAAASLLADLAFVAALRVASGAIGDVIRARLRSAGVTKAAVYEAAHGFEAALGGLSRSGSQRRLGGVDPDPAPEPQSAATLLDEIEGLMTRHMVLPPGAALVLAMWAMATWTLEAAEFTARLILTSPAMRCGKSRVLELLRLLCRRPLLAANVSAAVIFRAVEEARPTLLIDEADSFLAENEELRGILNAGYRYDGAVLRCVGDDHEPTQFSCFSPAAIAAIGGVPGTIADRGLTVRLERKAPGARVARVDRSARRAIESLRPRLARWGQDSMDALREARPALPESLNDRQHEIVEPLLAIAGLASAEHVTRATQAIVGLCLSGEGAPDRSERLLAAVWALYGVDAQSGEPLSEPIDFLNLKQIVRRLIEDEEGGWGTAARGREITTGHLARWLQQYGLRTTRLREHGRLRGYLAADLRPVVDRYLAPGARGRDGGTAVQPQGECEIPAVGQAEVENARKPNGHMVCPAVPPSPPPKPKRSTP